MVVVKLNGGLGNQLFQYAAALRLALKHRAQLKMDIRQFTQLLAHTTPRQYELKHFAIRGSLLPPDTVWRRWWRRATLQPRLTVIKEKHYHFDPAILGLGDNIYLDGYWQTAKYFSDVRQHVLDEFRVKTPLTERSRRLSARMHASNSVAVHIRRGDYVANPTTRQYHGVCSEAYYAAAAQRLTQRVHDISWYIFSDDIPWCRQHLKLPGATTFVDHNGPERAYDDLRLMSACKHFIIANSSFGWWGAWLSLSPQKIVIAPKRWFNTPAMNTTDVVPSDWITL